MRVLQGGHDVPSRKLKQRYPRTQRNLALAIRELPHVLVYDNGDLRRTFRKVAEFEAGKTTEQHSPLPRWLSRAITSSRRRLPARLRAHPRSRLSLRHGTPGPVAPHRATRARIEKSSVGSAV